MSYVLASVTGAHSRWMVVDDVGTAATVDGGRVCWLGAESCGEVVSEGVDVGKVAKPREGVPGVDAMLWSDAWLRAVPVVRSWFVDPASAASVRAGTTARRNDNARTKPAKITIPAVFRARRRRI